MVNKCWYFKYEVLNDKLYFKTSEKTLTITYSKKVNIKMYYGLFKTKSKKILNERTTTKLLFCQSLSVNPINTVIMIKNSALYRQNITSNFVFAADNKKEKWYVILI